MINKKYLCYGGTVFSRDGDRHYISVMAVARLYGVPIRECIFASETGDNIRGLDLDKFIILRPRADGNYTLPSLNKQEKP